VAATTDARGFTTTNAWSATRKPLAGMPVIRFLGPAARPMSTALKKVRHWRPFRVRLCPSLAGIELLKDGGYLTVELEAEAQRPAQFTFHHLRR